jgi:DNA sulfur modification protein DndB
MGAKKISRDYSISFPAIRGVQAGKEYYVTMCPLKLLPTMFQTITTDIPPELRAQRELNKGRVTPITRYLLDNSSNYIFSSIAASIDSEVQFEAFGDDIVGRKIGTLSVSMDAKFVINDGQHRVAAILEALKADTTLGNETISVVLFVDSGLSNTQQMFADLNRYAVRPTKSLSILYDHRDPLARLTNDLVKSVYIFKGMTEKAKSSISNRSRKLFTLSSIYQATKTFLQKSEGSDVSAEERNLTFLFWETVANNMPDWQAAVKKQIATSELRSDYIHAHGIALQALAIAGNSLIKANPNTWEKQLCKISTIDWARENAALWEGRALVGGTLNKSQKNVILTANLIKNVLGLPLAPNEEIVERNYLKGKNES